MIKIKRKVYQIQNDLLITQAIQIHSKITTKVTLKSKGRVIPKANLKIMKSKFSKTMEVIQKTQHQD